MKKRIVISALCLLFFAVAITPTAMAGEKMLKLASWGPVKHYIPIQRNEWIKEVNEKFAGRYKIVDYPGGQLYGPKDMQQAVAKGSIDIGVVLSPAIMGMVPIVQGVYLPFAFDTLDQAAKAYSGESLKIIEKGLEKKRIKLLYTAFTEPVQIFSNKKNINSIDDFKGLRILSTSTIMTGIMKDLGAAPDASIPFTEQYLALHRKVSDAVLIGNIGGFFNKMYEVAPYVTNVNLSYPTILHCMNLKTWKGLPKDVQDFLVSKGEEKKLASIASCEGWNTKFTGALAKSGCTVTTISPDVRNQIKSISSEAWNQWAKKNGDDAKKLLNINSKL